MSTKRNSQAEMKAAAPNDAIGEDDDDIGVLIYREVQLRKAEAASTADGESKKEASTASFSAYQRRTLTRKRTPVQNRSSESLPSPQSNGNFKRKKRLCSNEGGRPRKKVAKKRRRYKCSAVGCTNFAQKGGVCYRHGERKRCNSEGCVKFAHKGGVCLKHGAKIKRCNNEGCPNFAVKGGVCGRHGAERKRCSWEGCTNQVVKGGLCIRHGAKLKRCSSDGCTNQL